MVGRDTTVWVGENDDSFFFAYRLADGSRDSAKDFDGASDATTFITGDGTHVWTGDESVNSGGPARSTPGWPLAHLLDPRRPRPDTPNPQGDLHQRQQLRPSCLEEQEALNPAPQTKRTTNEGKPRVF